MTKRSAGGCFAALLIAVVAIAASSGCGRSVEHARIISLAGADGQTAYYRVVVRARGKAALRVGRYDASAVDAVLGGATSGRRQSPQARGKRRPSERTVVIFSRAAAAIEQAIEAATSEIAARRAIEHATRAVGQRKRSWRHRMRARVRRAHRMVAEVRRALRELPNTADKRARANALRRLLEDLAALPVGRARRRGGR